MSMERLPRSVYNPNPDPDPKYRFSYWLSSGVLLTQEDTSEAPAAYRYCVNDGYLFTFKRTDVDGMFALRAPEDDLLHVRYQEWNRKYLGEAKLKSPTPEDIPPEWGERSP